MSEEHKRKISQSLKGKMPKFIPNNKGRKVSSETRRRLSEAHIGVLVGSKSNNWKGGQNLSYWKKAVKRRDGKCMKCGINDKRVLTADHIKSKSMYPELKFDVNNGMTLCHNCHAIKTLEDKEYRKHMSKNHWKRNNFKFKKYDRK